MGKGKKAGKRMNKAQMAMVLEDFFKENPGKTFSFKEIFHKLKLDTHPLKMLAIDVMEEMAWDDFLQRVTDSSYRLADNTQVMEGIFRAKANGKNSFIPDGTDKPIFIAERNSMGALNGDRVKVSLMARRERHIREAEVIEILRRAKDVFVGRVKITNDMMYVVPKDSLAVNIFVPQRKRKGAKEGDNVVVRVISWPDNEHRTIMAEVVDNLGPSGDNTAEMHAILAQFGLPYKYPEAVEKAAANLSAEITEADYAEREDFRDVFTCTIDPHDAKDFDDALSIKDISKDGSGTLWEVGVHIADVSHYVHEGDIIDKEARERATSVYLVDRTIPMLPERLCNFVCSLRPNEEKLCYSVIFNLDNEANVKAYRIRHTVIKSDRRYAYEEVQQLLEDNGVIDGTGQPAPVRKEYKGENALQLIMLDKLAKKLREKRFKADAINFDTEELRFDIDADGKPTRCYYKRSKDANKLIEEFMLLANRTVAEHVGKVAKGKVAKTLPYRVHDNPDPVKLETLKTFAVKFGYRMGSSSTKGATARSLNRLIAESEDKPEGRAIQMVALRAMMKAKYTVHNIGHFGLAFDYYTHFTSPIRRYPDTMVHRLLTRYEEGGRSASKDKYEELCEHSSDMEQTAANAERESIKYKMVEFMSQYLGEEFDAHISGITSYGLYCEIDENHCEGMIAIHDLEGDYYEFDERNFCLCGRRHHTKYALGDAIRVRVAKANIEKRQLDFVLAD